MSNAPVLDYRPDPPLPQGRLGLADAISIIVGIIIGVGFIQSSPTVASAAGSVEGAIAVWSLGGLAALLGAVCYAELATMLPQEGGEYVFLTRAYGPRVGFLFAWTAVLVVRPGNIGAMALAFAAYARTMIPLPGLGVGAEAQLAWAVAAVLAFTGINALGLRGGKWTQNLLTAMKVIGLVSLFAVALTAPRVTTTFGTPAALKVPDWGLAMVLVLFAYGGWEDVTYVAGEVRNARRNLTRALLFGTGAVVAIYVLGTIAFFHSLGWSGVAASKAVAADVLRTTLGDQGAVAISLLVAVCALGALNGMVLTGSRIAYAAAGDHPALGFLGKWNGRRGVPMRSLLTQTAITIALLTAFGRDPAGFERMVIFTVPAFWTFYVLVGIGLMVLRWREPTLPRPYKVPLYPWTPLLFCATGGFMLHAGIVYAWAHQTAEAVWAVAVIIVGILITPLARRTSQKP